MPRSPRWTGPDTLETCVRRCLVGHQPVQVERLEQERSAVLSHRQEQGLTTPPVFSGLTGENITRCSELYTHEELVAIAQRHGVPLTRSHMGLCMRLLQRGLLNPDGP